MPSLDTSKEVKLSSIPGSPPDLMFPPKGDAFALRSEYALKIDLELPPPTYRFSETHSVKSWLYHEDAPKAEPPKIIKDLSKYFDKTSSNS